MADVLNLTIDGRVDSIEEAFAWVLDRIEQYDLDEPVIGIHPVWTDDGTGNFTRLSFDARVEGVPRQFAVPRRTGPFAEIHKISGDQAEGRA